MCKSEAGFYGLTTEFQSRYLNKLALCDGIDPYCMKKGEFSTDFIDLPNLQFPDISNDLVVQPLFYSKNQMKASKSLETYNFFISGWVNELGVKQLKDNHLVFARVSMNTSLCFHVAKQNVNSSSLSLSDIT